MVNRPKLLNKSLTFQAKKRHQNKVTRKVYEYIKLSYDAIGKLSYDAILQVINCLPLKKLLFKNS